MTSRAYKIGKGGSYHENLFPLSVGQTLRIAGNDGLVAAVNEDLHRVHIVSIVDGAVVEEEYHADTTMLLQGRLVYCDWKKRSLTDNDLTFFGKNISRNKYATPYYHDDN
ncbi:MAG: hypothetical protein AABX16_00095 [Nanoarchaeota archaeon]